jgi:MFS family permease
MGHATVLGTGLVFIDATVVNIALPSIGTELHASAAALQWTVNGYTLSLAALILLGGSLGDRYGRRRVFLIGVGWFALASLLCGLAPNVETLIAARVLQGVGGAVLTPGALAILEASFQPADRAKAIGAWSGLGGIAGALGPFLGGWLVEAAPGVPDQRAARRDRRPRGAAARAGDPRHHRDTWPGHQGWGSPSPWARSSCTGNRALGRAAPTRPVYAAGGCWRVVRGTMAAAASAVSRASSGRTWA